MNHSTPFSEKRSAWHLAKGDYTLSLGFDSQKRPLSHQVTVKSEKVVKVNDVMRPAEGELFIK